MFNPMLRIPEQAEVTDSYQGVMPDEISVQNWLNQRDHLDTQAFLDMLIDINRVKCEPSERMAIMNIMEGDIKEELEDLFEKTATVSFPINEEYQSLIDKLQYLLLESSVAYQIIIHDIAENEEYVEQYLGTLIPEALFMAMYYLSRLLVERFQFYLSEPVYAWQELNQLYLLAERIGAQDDIIKDGISTKHKYLQIVILRILNPYRMMRLEARKIYQLLKKWIDHCEIVSYSKYPPENHFVVNLLADNYPHQYEADKDSKQANGRDFEGRVIGMQKLRIYIDAFVNQVEQQKKKHLFSYQSRMHNEMLRRIDNDLTLQEERSEERRLAGNEIKLVAGLRACHHFISQRKKFDPQAEIDAQQQDKIEQASKKDEPVINLISLLEEERLLSKKNPMGELQSLNPFMDSSEVVGDEWDHIHSNSVVEANIQDQESRINQNLKEENWKQRNESAHGMLLVCKTDIEMPIAVGMLVAYRLNVEKAYCLASVKWLRVNPLKGMAIGLKLIAVQSRAIAVKGDEGTGFGGQFQQAFLISENDTKGKGGKQNLIVPAGVYDEGSILKVWHNKKLNRVEISKILTATDSFEQVAFHVVKKEKPPQAASTKTE